MSKILDQNLNLNAQDFDFTDTSIASARRLRIDFSNVLLDNGGDIKFRARNSGGLLNANGNYMYVEDGCMQDNGTGQKPVPDTNGNEIDGLTSTVRLFDSPVQAHPDTVMSGIIEILNPGINLAPKHMYFRVLYKDDEGRLAEERGGALISTGAAIIGFRLYSGSNIVGGHIAAWTD